MWAWLSPHTYYVLQCLAASLPVMAGYAQTGRAAALGHIAPGDPSLLLPMKLCTHKCVYHSTHSLHRPGRQAWGFMSMVALMAGSEGMRRAAATICAASGNDVLCYMTLQIAVIAMLHYQPWCGHVCAVHVCLSIRPMYAMKFCVAFVSYSAFRRICRRCKKCSRAWHDWASIGSPLREDFKTRHTSRDVALPGPSTS